MPSAEWMVDPDYLIPAEHLLSVSITAAEGRSVSSQQLPGSAGSLSVGWLGCLLDATGGRPLAFALPDGTRCTTVGMRVDVVGRLPLAGELVHGRGELLHMGPDFAVSRATVTAGDGVEIATAVLRFLLAPDVATIRVPEAALVPAKSWGSLPDLGAGLGVQRSSVSAERAELFVVPTPAFGNPYAIVHGGMHFALADLAMSAAVGAEYTLLDVALGFHRPIPIDGSPVRVVATVRQRGKRVVVAESVLVGHDGVELTTVRGTFGRVG